jgi:DNA-binding NarL/FixJ family response regulator
MPRVDGIQATALIIRRYPAICIIGHSVHEDLNVIGRFKSAGAMAFVTKTSVAEELYDAIKSSVQNKKACDGDRESQEL